MRKSFAAIGFLVFILLSSGWLGGLIFLPPAWTPYKTTVYIPRGISTWEAGKKLQEKGLLKSPLLFLMAAKATGVNILSGEYVLSPHLNLMDVLHKFENGGSPLSVPVTFPEGFTARQIAARLEENGLSGAPRFLKLSKSKQNFSAKLPFTPVPYCCEGFLFPDTYLIRQDEKEEQIITKMLDNFSRKLPADFSARARKMGFSPYELLILASLVEKEARRQNEQSVIASVMVNRLRRHMRLQVDATVQYALGNDKYERLMHSDLKVESPYNTYLHKGLPPTPIANPGLSALRAVMNPSQTKFLYYVARKNGSHIFSTNYDDHVNAINKIRKGL